MQFDPRRVAVLALHWQVNVIEPEGFFGGMLAEPVRQSGVVVRAAQFHRSVIAAGVPVFFTRFTIPVGEGQLVRNTAFMSAVGDSQDAFRPDAAGTQLIGEMLGDADPANVVDNQKLSGLAGNDLTVRLADRGIGTVLITGVATNLTVEQTARHGTDLGLTVHPVSDCVAAASPDAHEGSLGVMELVTAGSRTAADVLAALA